MSERAWQWAEVLGHWSLAWTVVVVAVGVWIRLGRPRRVALRYWGWCWATFAGAALAPMVLAVGPQVSWRDAVALIQPASAPTARAPARFVSWFEGISAVVPRDVPDASPGVERPAPGPSKAPVGRTLETPPADRLAGSSDRWLSIALAVWAAGFLVFAARLAWAAARVRVLLAQSTAIVPAGLAAELESTRRALGLCRAVRVVVHPEIDAPMCVGLFRPVVLWPTEENCPMTSTQRRASLTHELAHLRQFDDWVGLLAEAWRSVSWFYVPVHWTIGRLRLERESRCDEIAAGHFESPERYARWLLDLAPIKVRPPVLASSLLGGTDLAARIRRLLDRAPRPTRPLSRRQIGMWTTLTFALLAVAGSVRLVGFAARAAQADAADAPLPEISPKALAEKIVESRKRYAAGLLVVEFDEERGTLARADEVEAPGNMRFPGRFQYASDGRLWRVEFDSMMPNAGPRKLVPHRWASGFDGTRHYTWTIRDNQVKFGEAEIAATTLTPAELFWHRGDDLFEMLGKPGAKVGQRTIDGVRCYVVERTTTRDQVKWGTEYLISPRQSYLAVGLTYERGERRYFSHRLLNLHKTDAGLWIPDRVTSGAEPKPDVGLSRFDSRRLMRVVRYEPSKSFEEGEFTLKVPINADVNDFALGTSYCNDPWWPEIGKLLRERFDWPKVDLLPLLSLQTHGDPPIIGRPAPAIDATLWINSGPVDWENLRGKVVLIDFSALVVRQEIIPGLRKLVETYGPAGLEVISVLSPRDSPEDVRQFVRELRITHPVAIDRPHEEGYGATREGFGMKSEVSSFLVDRKGIVHRITREHLIEDLVPLLRKANAGKVEPLSLETAELTDKMIREVDQAWQGWVTQAVSTGKITGKVIDSRGRPVVDARVRATMEARVLTFSNAHFLFQRKTPQAAASGPDGSFVLPGFSKGNYTLRITTPGFATVERPVLITDALGAAAILVVLSQSDTISGRVVDEAGKPVVGAETILSERRLMHPDGTQTNFNGFLEGKVTDSDGRFHFVGLSEGDFTLRVNGKGFLEAKRERVPAGKTDLELTIRRPESR